MYVSGNIFYGISQWIILLGILKIFGNYDAGIYSLGVAIISPLILFFSLGLNTLYVTDKRYEYNVYSYNRNFYSIILAIVYISIIYSIGKDINSLYLLLLVGFHKLLENQFDMIFAFYIENKQQEIIGKIKILQSIVICFSFIIGSFVVKNLNIIFILVNLLFLLQLIYYDKKLGTGFKIRFNKDLLKTGLLLSFALLISSLNTNIPKYYLEYQGLTEYIGIFSSIIVLYSAGKILFQSIYSFLLPRIVDNICNQKILINYFKKINLYLIIISIISLLISIFLYEYWVPIIFTTEFMNYKFEIIIAILGSFFIFQSILMDMFIYSYKNYRLNLASQIVVVSLVTLSLILFNDINALTNAMISFLVFGLSVSFTKTIVAIWLIRRGLKVDKS
ncbi:hypothetical protein [Macrococcoides caseolyticum]|uniref:hypothetical protein n=1 Tax=Macrococcoides caseolyticum TaxID=69966 RepID=UPI001F209546|nr:hypothetical protein [Macrococcus caseolyticus]MCE4955675.1 hypothetical protein [Macrococcus caseolyticus]